MNHSLHCWKLRYRALTVRQSLQLFCVSYGVSDVYGCSNSIDAEQASRLDRQPPALCFATAGFLPATQVLRYSNAHNAEAAVALYERAEDSLRCCHDFALNNSELRSRILQVALDHGMVP
jgi:hypothetical protein